jgi:exonuclease SbcD
MRKDMTMRILHTSDWHIGRVWSGVDLLDTQRQFGQWLCDVVKAERIDAVLVAGDIYDRAVPSADAVSVADEIFTNVAAAGATIVAISGNHDSADRLHFGSSFMAGGGLHIRTERADLTALGAPITIKAPTGESVDVVCLPFLEPNRVDLTEEQGDRTHENVLRVALQHQRSMVVDPSRAIVMAHAFVGGGESSKSERDLVSVGGTSMVNHRLFDGFGYVALGHLHRPQQFGANGNVVYSGSPIPYSFSEEHQKSVVILDTTVMTSTKIPVGVGRGVVTIKGKLGELLTSREYEAAAQLYVRIELTDEQVQIGAMESIRTRFPHALELVQTAINGDGSIEEIVGGKARSVTEEVADYMDEYFDATQHPFKHELADKAVVRVVNSMEV